MSERKKVSDSSSTNDKAKKRNVKEVFNSSPVSFPSTASTSEMQHSNILSQPDHAQIKDITEIAKLKDSYRVGNNQETAQAGDSLNNMPTKTEMQSDSVSEDYSQVGGVAKADFGISITINEDGSYVIGGTVSGHSSDTEQFNEALGWAADQFPSGYETSEALLQSYTIWLSGDDSTEEEANQGEEDNDTDSNSNNTDDDQDEEDDDQDEDGGCENPDKIDTSGPNPLEGTPFAGADVLNRVVDVTKNDLVTDPHPDDLYAKGTKVFSVHVIKSVNDLTTDPNPDQAYTPSHTGKLDVKILKLIELLINPTGKDNFLGVTPNNHIVVPLSTLMKSQNTELLVGIINAMSLVSKKESIAPISAFLNHGNEYVRKTAFQTLKNLNI